MGRKGTLLAIAVVALIATTVAQPAAAFRSPVETVDAGVILDVSPTRVLYRDPDNTENGTIHIKDRATGSSRGRSSIRALALQRFPLPPRSDFRRRVQRARDGRARVARRRAARPRAVGLDVPGRRRLCNLERDHRPLLHGLSGCIGGIWPPASRSRSQRTPPTAIRSCSRTATCSTTHSRIRRSTGGATASQSNSRTTRTGTCGRWRTGSMLPTERPCPARWGRATRRRGCD